MEVKNLDELFTEFKKYRETKKNVANKDNFHYYTDDLIYYSVSEVGISEK